MKVLVVEDDPMIAEDLCGILRKLNYHVPDPIYEYEEALQVLKAPNKPGLITIDINLNGSEKGIALGQHVHDVYQIPFIYITSYSDKSTVLDASATSPIGYIVKPFNEATIFSTLIIALNNYEQQKALLFPQLSLSKINQKQLSPVSDREFEVIKLVGEGRSNQEISDLLFISLNTTKKHLKNIFEKLHVENRHSLLVKVRELMK